MKAAARNWSFRKRRAFASRSSSSRAARRRTGARARRCPGGRRNCRWRTRKAVARRFMRARSRAGSKRPGASCFASRGSRRVRNELKGSRGRRRRALDRRPPPGRRARGEQQFGGQGCYLIDFYHVCEYLGAASAAIAPDPVARDAWMETQKGALKDGRLDAVLQRAVAANDNSPDTSLRRTA